MLCSSVMVLEKGGVSFRGEVEEGLAHYEAEVGGERTLTLDRFQGALRGQVVFEEISPRQGGVEAEVVDPNLPLEIEVRGRALRDFDALEVNIGVFRDGFRLFSCHDGAPATPMRAGPFVSRFTLEAPLLRPGRYTVGLGAYRSDRSEILWSPEVMALQVSEKWSRQTDEREVGALTVAVRGERRQ